MGAPVMGALGMVLVFAGLAATLGAGTVKRLVPGWPVVVSPSACEVFTFAATTAAVAFNPCSACAPAFQSWILAPSAPSFSVSVSGVVEELVVMVGGLPSVPPLRSSVC